MSDPRVRCARWAELDSATAYGILRLRSIVFVVEQRCAYLDMDGQDLVPEARQLWIEDSGQVVSALRLLRLETGVHKIGRVATHPEHRGQGLGAALIRRAVELCGDDVVLNAQAHLADWYATFGFSVAGEQWTEDGIVHVPMRRSLTRRYSPPGPRAR